MVSRLLTWGGNGFKSENVRMTKNNHLEAQAEGLGVFSLLHSRCIPSFLLAALSARSWSTCRLLWTESVLLLFNFCSSCSGNYFSRSTFSKRKGLKAQDSCCLCVSKVTARLHCRRTPQTWESMTRCTHHLWWLTIVFTCLCVFHLLVSAKWLCSILMHCSPRFYGV